MTNRKLRRSQRTKKGQIKKIIVRSCQISHQAHLYSQTNNTDAGGIDDIIRYHSLVSGNFNLNFNLSDTQLVCPTGSTQEATGKTVTVSSLLLSIFSWLEMRLNISTVYFDWLSIFQNYSDITSSLRE